MNEADDVSLLLPCLRARLPLSAASYVQIVLGGVLGVSRSQTGSIAWRPRSNEVAYSIGSCVIFYDVELREQSRCFPGHSCCTDHCCTTVHVAFAFRTKVLSRHQVPGVRLVGKLSCSRRGLFVINVVCSIIKHEPVL